jgi:hypothetical protein
VSLIKSGLKRLPTPPNARINPDSLAPKIIEGKYYPQSTILEATLGKQPSFA